MIRDAKLSTNTKMIYDDKRRDFLKSAIEQIRRFVDMYSVVEVENVSDPDFIDNYNGR